MTQEARNVAEKRHIPAVALYLLFFIVFAHAAPAPAHAAAVPGENAAEAGQGSGEPQRETFPIRRFVIIGETIFPRNGLRRMVDDLCGESRTAADVETARDRLEKYYHDNGYPTTLVNIPEQSIEGGFVYLQVIKGEVGSASVTGNRWVSEERIWKRLPSLKAGEVVNLQNIKKQLTEINEGPDLQVTPNIAPGKETGKVDVQLKVEDKLPLHGSLELTNRNSMNTTDLRLNATLRYDDLWGVGHSISAQYQTAPEKPSEVQVFSGSYTLAPTWNRNDRIVLYGVLSDSETGFGEGFKTVGNGSIVGLRYQKPLSPYGAYNHNLTLGVDYKRFQESQTTSNKVTYVPFSLAYGASLADRLGVTQVNAALNLVFRGLGSSSQEFDTKRTSAKDNYVVLLPGLERTLKLPGEAELRLKVDGQVSDQPLISNEQYSAGGMDTVRGYYESEVSGDNALHFTAEVAAPDLAARAGLEGKGQLVPYLFYDYASVRVKQPLPGQAYGFDISATGVGIRGGLPGSFEYELDGAFALRDGGNSATNTVKGDGRALFKVKGLF